MHKPKVMQKVRVGFTLQNNHGVDTFAWSRTGEISDRAELIEALNTEIRWMQSKALKMKATGSKIGRISATNKIVFSAAVMGEHWEDIGLETVLAKLGHIRLCTRNAEGWQAADHAPCVELVVEAATRTFAE